MRKLNDKQLNIQAKKYNMNQKLINQNKKKKNKNNFINLILSYKYEGILNEIKTNPRYLSFNQIYFHAGDIQQFERYGYLQSRLLQYYDFKDNEKYKIYSENNYETTYQTFQYIFDKFKKGIYIIIKNNELNTFLPFSNVHYKNNWSKILEESNEKLVDKLKRNKDHHNDPARWYANNCFFSMDNLKYKFNKYLVEGDKTIVQFKYFLIDY